MVVQKAAMTIDEVLERLDGIIAASLKDNDHLGFFAYIYRRTTYEIKKAILANKFEDNPRMEKFDVLFANKYLEVFDDFRAGRQVCRSWTVSFRAKKERMTILQHIILGMNAHINYDLGVAADEFIEEGVIDGFQNDFMMVNQVLAGLLDEMQVKVGRVSKLMFLIDWLGGRKDEVILNFSMEKARQQAWDLATRLKGLTGDEKETKKAEADRFTANLGEIVKRPPGKILRYVVKLVSLFEIKDIKKVVKKLEQD